MRAVLDTCAVLWYTLEPDTLSLKAHKVIASAENVIISAISIWEIGLKATKGKIDLGVGYLEYVDRLSKISGVEILPVDHVSWAKSVVLNWSHRDPADRLIVAVAQELDATIISDDAEMKKFYRKVLA